MFNSVKISILTGILAFLITWIIILITKPKELLKVQDSKKINYFKASILSVLFGSFFTLAFYLFINDDYGTKFDFALC